MSKKRVKNCIFFIIIFLGFNIGFFLLGSSPKHILEEFQNYFTPNSHAVSDTIINIVFWSISTIFIGLFLNCRRFSGVIRELFQLKYKFLIILAIQIVFDFCSWFIMYSDYLSMYVCVYRTFVIMISWLIIYHFFAPSHINSPENSKYKYAFIIFCILVTLIFVILDFTAIAKYKQSSGSLSSILEGDNYLSGIMQTMNKYILFSNACEQRHLILDCVISAVFFVTHTLACVCFEKED